jgi:hypothetical protein
VTLSAPGALSPNSSQELQDAANNLTTYRNDNGPKALLMTLCKISQYI